MEEDVAVVDSSGIIFFASLALTTGVEAVIFRIRGGKLIYAQPDGSLKDAQGRLYHFVARGNVDAPTA